MGKQTHANYQASMKILLRDKENILLLTDRRERHFDLPGGRIDEVEHKTPFTKIIEREVEEELGKKVKYSLGSPLFQFRRHFKDKQRYVLITVYEANLLSGQIRLSKEHSKYQWINPKKFKLNQKDFFNKEEYLAFKSYFTACP